MENEYLNIGFFGDHQSGKTSLIEKILGNEVNKNTFFEKTIDFNYYKLNLQDEKKKYVIYDTPGLRKYIKTTSMIMNNMDCFFIVISILDDELDFSLSKMGILLDLLVILFSLQIKKIYIVLNKFDDSVISFSEEIYNSLVKKIEKKIKQIGYRNDCYEFIPISIFEDENILTKKENLSWHNGDTILDIIKKQKYELKNEKMPLRFTTIKYYRITGKGTVIVGYVKSGKIKKDDKVILLPNMKETIVKSINYFDEELDEAKRGALVGLNVKGVDLKEVKRGLIVCHIDFKDEEGNIIERKLPYRNDISCFVNAKIVVLNHPNGIKVDSIYMMHIHSGRIPVLIKNLTILKKNKEIYNEENINNFITKGCLGNFELILLKPLKVEKYNEWNELGSFFLYDMNNPYCYGMIYKIEFKKYEEAEEELENDSEKENPDNKNRQKKSTNDKLKKMKSLNENKIDKLEDRIPIKKSE